ncbi:MAG: hypothetical protein FJZ61_02625 [Chlamydiae bacterium]|nr:hypothetical protein [Chlamydiota bacterium]
MSQQEKKFKPLPCLKGLETLPPLRLGATIAFTICAILNVPLITYSHFLNQIEEKQSQGALLLDARSGLAYTAECIQEGGKVYFTPTTPREKKCEAAYQACKKKSWFS